MRGSEPRPAETRCYDAGSEESDLTAIVSSITNAGRDLRTAITAPAATIIEAAKNAAPGRCKGLAGDVK